VADEEVKREAVGEREARLVFAPRKQSRVSTLCSGGEPTHNQAPYKHLGVHVKKRLSAPRQNAHSEATRACRQRHASTLWSRLRYARQDSTRQDSPFIACRGLATWRKPIERGQAEARDLGRLDVVVAFRRARGHAAPHDAKRPGLMATASAPTRAALVVVDVQNDFFQPHGSLVVPRGTEVIPVINRLRSAREWALIAFSKDWHPRGHVSFFASHKNNQRARLFEELELPDGSRQVLWPTHCVEETHGAQFHPDLHLQPSDHVIKKGTNQARDSYSAFSVDGTAPTKLLSLLQQAGVQEVYVCGLALDYCVGATALDAAALGFRVLVVKDATRAVSEASGAEMLKRLQRADVQVVHSLAATRSPMLPTTDRALHAADYFAKHRIPQLFERLCASLVLHRPSNPREFLLSELERIRRKQPFFDERDLASTFALVNPLDKPDIASQQTQAALLNLGVPRYRAQGAAGATPLAKHEFVETAAALLAETSV
jgi:nicotinamidase/pyrazinamidase